MNWDAIGAVGEIVGAAAVVVTLFYLSLQLRQAKKATDRNSEIVLAATYQSRAEASQQLMMELAESEFVAPLLAKVRQGGGFPKFSADALSEEERGRLRAFGQAMRIGLDNQHYQYELGLLDKEYYESSVLPSIEGMVGLWNAANLTPLRPSFEKIVRDAERKVTDDDA